MLDSGEFSSRVSHAARVARDPATAAEMQKSFATRGLALSSADLHQIAKDSDSGALVLSGLLGSPDLREL